MMIMKIKNIVKRFLKLSEFFNNYQIKFANVCKQSFCNAAVKHIDETGFKINVIGAEIHVECRYVTVDKDSDSLFGKVTFNHGDIRLKTVYFDDDGMYLSSLKQFHDNKSLLDDTIISQTLFGLVEKLIELNIFPKDYEV